MSLRPTDGDENVFCGARTLCVPRRDSSRRLPAATAIRFEAHREINALPPIFRGEVSMMFFERRAASCATIDLKWKLSVDAPS
jgi:hypothetical protein